NNMLDEAREKFIFETTKEIVEECGDSLAGREERREDASAHGKLVIACIPSRDEADELIALMLAQILSAEGHRAQAVPLGSVEETLRGVVEMNPDVLFISALPPSTLSHTRLLCRKARQGSPGLKVVIGLWGSGGDLQMFQERLGAGCSEFIVRSLSQAVKQVHAEESPSAADADTDAAVQEAQH
ncbi:MAG: cobalamin-dependent protein, partial [Acidobacteriaceae bacterium]|nr:cobalamin-dependent protein [Acidobacteriaceae bacterium]